MLSLRAVEVRFADDGRASGVGRVALAIDELDIADGARLALVGASGGGKSTLLRVIAGLVPFTGEVRVRGEVLTEASLQAHRRAMGYVLQEGGLFPHLSARANVTLLARSLGRDVAWIADRCGSLAELVGLTARHLESAPEALSGGERQRVALMRALFLEPRLLLLDEPLGALDAIVRRKLQDDLQRILESTGITVLLVTHDLEEARFLCDEIAILDGGRIVQRGSYEALETTPATDYVRALLAAQKPRVVQARGAER
jgi:osmoprotectant transport system ATP-binding protein